MVLKGERGGGKHNTYTAADVVKAVESMNRWGQYRARFGCASVPGGSRSEEAPLAPAPSLWSAQGLARASAHADATHCRDRLFDGGC
jgi:hypothetical protein